MYIKSLAVKNTLENWVLEKVSFDYNLTLLVGITGAGKTQILTAIDHLQRVVRGGSVGGFEWDVVVELENKKQYQWSGNFYYDESGKGKIGEINFPLIEREIIKEVGADSFIINRNRTEILFKGTKLPKVSRKSSAITLFIEEIPLKNIGQLLSKIIYRNNTERSKPLIIDKNRDATNIVVESLEQIKNLGVDSLVKYYLAQQQRLPITREILATYSAIFNEVKFIYVNKTLENDYVKLYVSIDHKGSRRPINQEAMSSGMLRVFMLLIDLHFSPDGSIFLIDEIENSLGINCLDEYVHQLQHANPNIQIIATSHHPYIINNIPYQQWKIVQRKEAVIKVHNAEDFHIGSSRQAAFVQLTKILHKK
ncbi:MAG: AAA family ATPase [Aureispira sp.]